MPASEGFVIEEDAKKERANWRKILKKTEGDEPEMSGGVAEPKKRNGGNHAGADEQDRQRPVGTGENKRVRSLKINEKNESKRNEQDRFDKQTGNGGGAGLFAEQSIKTKGD